MNTMEIFILLSSVVHKLHLTPRERSRNYPSTKNQSSILCASIDGDVSCPRRAGLVWSMGLLITSLLSLAVAAQKYRLTRPSVTEHNVINIVGGRHPLQELVVPTFIENDTCLVGGGSDVNEINAASVLLLTGANYSGKSVYLKQVSRSIILHVRLH